MRWMTWALLLIGAVRLITFATHDPLLAYASQYSVARSSGCLGLSPDDKAVVRDAGHFVAPLPDYRYGQSTAAACLPSTEVAIAALAVGLDRLGEWLSTSSARDFDLQQLALLKAALMLMLAVVVHCQLRGSPRWQLGHAAVFALLLCDPFNLLYLGTLYTEFGALFGAWLVLAMLCVVALRRERGGRFGAVPIAGFALGVLMLGASRVQHLLHPTLLLVVVVLWLTLSRDRRSAISQPPAQGRRLQLQVLLPLLVAVVVAFGFQLRNQQQQEHIADANRLNMFFAGVLPSSDQPEHMLERVDLPPNCIALNHVSWYLSRGHEPLAECPQLQTLSRFRVMLALLADPLAGMRLLGRGLMQSTAWRLPYLGEVAGAEYQRAPFFSLVEPLAQRGFVFQALLWTLPLLLCPLLLWRLLRGRHKAADLLCVVLSVWIVLTWAAALLGDGYSELTRHLHLAQNAILVLWLAAIPVTVTWLRAVIARPASRRTRPLALAGALVVGCLLFAMSWSRLPMAMGLIDSPNGQMPVAARVEVSGWLLSVNGVDAARARAGSAPPVALRIAEPTTSVSSYFPLNAQRSVQQFHGVLQLPAPVGSAQRLSVEVDEGNGEWREVNAVQIRQVAGPEVKQSSFGRAAERVP